MAGRNKPIVNMKSAVKKRQKAEQEKLTPQTLYLSGSDLLERDYPDQPVIGGLLGEKESLLLVGPPGLGKSVLTLNLGLSCAVPPQRGLWGIFPIPQKITTLFVQSENSAKATQARLRKIIQADSEFEKGAEGIFFAGADCRLVGLITDPSFQANIKTMIQETGAGLLILDPLISYHGQDENDNAAMRQSLDQITMIQDDTGVAVIVVHHVAKAKPEEGVFSGRGASAIGDWCANMLVLSRAEGAGQDHVIMRCTHAKARNYETQPDFFLERTSDLLLCRINRPGDAGRIPKREAVITALQKLGGSADKQSVLIQAVMVELNTSKSTARRALEIALEDRAIFVTSDGGYKVEI